MIRNALVAVGIATLIYHTTVFIYGCVLGYQEVMKRHRERLAGRPRLRLVWSSE